MYFSRSLYACTFSLGLRLLNTVLKRVCEYCSVQHQLGFLQALEDDGSTLKSKVLPIPLFKGQNSIGRDDLVSASKQVSRKHVVLNASPDGIFELSVVRLFLM